MLLGESIRDIYMCFTEITINGKSFRKPMPMKRWPEKCCDQVGTKIITIEEAQDLKTLKSDDLVGKFITYEIH